MALYKKNPKHMNECFFNVSLIDKNTITLAYKSAQTNDIFIGKFVDAPCGSKGILNLGIVVRNTKFDYILSKKYKYITSIKPSLCISKETVSVILAYSYAVLQDPAKLLKLIVPRNLQTLFSSYEKHAHLRFKETICHGSIEDRYVFYKRIIDSLPTQGHLVLILPHTKALNYWHEKFKEYSPFVIKGTNKKIEGYPNNNVILSTWVFAFSVPNLSHIIIDCAEDKKYTLMYPKINIVDLARNVALENNKTIIYGMENPPLHFLAKKIECTKPVNFNFISMHLHKITGTLLNEKFFSILKNNSNTGKQTVIIFNTKSNASLKRCIACNYHNKCSCRGTLLIYQNLLKCSQCKKMYNYKYGCLKCTSASCIHKIFNLEDIKYRIQERSTEYNVMIVQKLQKLKTVNSAPILLGTHADIIELSSKLIKIHTIVVLAPDKLLLTPQEEKDVFAVDRIYCSLSSLYYHFSFSRIRTNPTIEIFYSNKCIEDMVESECLSPCKLLKSNEMQSRKKYFLPPYGRCFSITLSCKTKVLDKDSIDKVYSFMQNYVLCTIILEVKHSVNCLTLFVTISSDTILKKMNLFYQEVYPDLKKAHISCICNINTTSTQ